MATKPLKFKHRPAQKLRAEVFIRDNFTCQVCSWRPPIIPDNYDGKRTIACHSEPWRMLELDHVHPRLKDGTHDIDNLRTICNRCNSSKGAN